MPLKMDEPPQNPVGLETGHGTRLALLGAFSLTNGSGEIEITAKKSRALLAILALSPNQQATRERLCGLLWSDRGEEQARGSLRQALAVLRKELGPLGAGVLVSRDDILALRPKAAEVDALQLLKLAAASDAAALRQAAELCRGLLLADTSVRDPGLEDWLASERRRFTDVAITVLEKLSRLETGAAAIATARRLLEFDPLRESSHRALIKTLAAAGETALALQQWEACRAILKAEFGVEPAPETLHLRGEILKRQTAPVAPAPRPPGPAAASEFTTRHSVAVLPFANLSNDPEQQYFSDGLSEDLITDLSKAPGMAVIAAHSALKFRGSDADPANAAHELGASHIVQGSVRRLADSVRINVKLFHAATGSVLWADRFDRRMEDIHDLQTEIARQVSIALSGPALQSIERYRPASLEAFDLVMRGRKEFRHSDEAGSQAAPLFEKAIALDPNYSEAYRWLALGQYLSWLHFGAPVEPARSLAMVNARKAATCDPGDAAAHAILAFILMYELQWDAASAEFELALKLNPYDGDTWCSLSDLRVMEGRGRDAVYCAERSLDRNPHPLGSCYWLLGQAQIAAGDYEAAVTTLRREETYGTGSRRFLAAALALLGRLDESREEARHFMAATPHFRISRWAATQPFRDLAMRDHFVQAYRMAGLPD